MYHAPQQKDAPGTGSLVRRRSQRGGRVGATCKLGRLFWLRIGAAPALVLWAEAGHAVLVAWLGLWCRGLGMQLRVGMNPR